MTAAWGEGLAPQGHSSFPEEREHWWTGLVSKSHPCHPPGWSRQVGPAGRSLRHRARGRGPPPPQDRNTPPLSPF